MAENKLADLSMDFAVIILKTTDSIKGHYDSLNSIYQNKILDALDTILP